MANLSRLDSYQGVIFDIDDTLYLEQDYVRSGFTFLNEWALERLGIQGFGNTCFNLFQQGVRQTIFDVALDALKVDKSPALIGALVSAYRNHQPTIELTGDSRIALDLLCQTKRIAFLTGGPVESQRAKVSALGLDRYSKDIVFSGISGPEYDKPHPSSWLKMQEIMDLPADSLIYIGDNPKKDFDAPVELGWGALRVRRVGSLNFDVESPSSIPELNDLLEILM